MEVAVETINLAPKTGPPIKPSAWEKNMSEWKLCWDNKDMCRYIEFREIDEKGNILISFALQAPSHAKLYYALKDWFGD
jgi:hypothetical protein